VIELERYTVSNLESDVRLLDFTIGLFPQIKTKNAAKKAIKRHQLLLNGKVTTSGVWMKNGDVLTFVDPLKGTPKKYDLEIEIIYEDEWLSVVNKPAGLRVSGNYHKTLENCLVGVIETKGDDGYRWAKPVHRLDGSTQGLVVIAKSLQTHQRLSRLFEHRKIQKTYFALVAGRPVSQLIKVDLDGKEAFTNLEVIKSVPSLQSEFITMVRLNPITGRTHQLRRHCAMIGSPIVGDTLYGEENNTLLHKGLFLVSLEISFDHPESEGRVKVSTKMPSKFDSLLEREERRWKKFNH
jgi:RluA family pseudouridine synthase